MTVTGAGSTWSNSSGVNVGNSGTGTLTIADGGIVTAAGFCDRDERRCGRNTQHRRGRGQSGGCTRHAHAPSVAFGAGTGTLNFNHTSANYVFAPAISGNGTVNVLAGTTMLTGANTYSGATNVNAGTLRAGAPNTFSPNSAVTVASGGTLDLNGFSQTVPSVTNAGLVNMGTGTAPGTVLTTTNYTGTGGTIGDEHLSRDRWLALGPAGDRRRHGYRHDPADRHERRRRRRPDHRRRHPGRRCHERRHDRAWCLCRLCGRRPLRLSSLPWRFDARQRKRLVPAQQSSAGTARTTSARSGPWPADCPAPARRRASARRFRSMRRCR